MDNLGLSIYDYINQVPNPNPIVQSGWTLDPTSGGGNFGFQTSLSNVSSLVSTSAGFIRIGRTVHMTWSMTITPTPTTTGCTVTLLGSTFSPASIQPAARINNTFIPLGGGMSFIVTDQTPRNTQFQIGQLNQDIQLQIFFQNGFDKTYTVEINLMYPLAPGY